MSGMRAAPVDPEAEPRYDAYVAAHPRATLYHRGAWARILRDSYRFEPRYLAVTDDAGEFHGVLPLVYKKGLVSSARIRSLPVIQWGGPLADTRDQEIMLMRAAREMAVGAESLLAILSTTDYAAQLPDFVADTLPSSWVVRVDGDLDELRAGWRKTSNNPLPQPQEGGRRRVCLSRGNLQARPVTFLPPVPADDAPKHRSLPRSLREFSGRESCSSRASGGCSWSTTTGRSLRVGRSRVRRHRGADVQRFDERPLHLRPNHALYWNVIRWAAAHGQTAFDFRPSKA